MRVTSNSTFDNSIMFRWVPKSIAPLGKSMSVKLSRNYQMSSVKSRRRAHTHLTVCAHLVGENINQLVFRTMGHMGTGTRHLVRTLGDRWPLLLDPRGSRGKSARGTKNPLLSKQGSVSLWSFQKGEECVFHVKTGIQIHADRVLWLGQRE